jgi:ketosteroid isomerase-like protein
MKQIAVIVVLPFLILTACKTLDNKKERKTMTSENDTMNATRMAVEKFNAAFNRHDVDAVMDAMTEDCVFENTSPTPDGTRIEGAAAVRAYWQKFFAANQDALFETEEIFATGDRCVVRWIYRKTKDGKPWHLRGVDIFKVKDGKVSEKLAYVKG